MNKKTECCISIATTVISGALCFVKVKELIENGEMTKTDFKKAMNIVSDISKTFSKNS